MGFLDKQALEEESSYIADATKAVATGLADIPVKGANLGIEALDLVTDKDIDYRIQLPSEDPVITQTVDNTKTFEAVGDVTRTIAGGALLRSQLGLKGGSLVKQGVTIGVTDAIASAGLNDMDNEHIFLDKVYGDTEKGTIERKALNVAEEALIGTSFELAVPYIGKGIKSFLKGTNRFTIEGITGLFTKGDPSKTRVATDAEIPSSSLGTDLDIDPVLSTGGIPDEELPALQRAEYQAKRKVDLNKKRKKRLAKKIERRYGAVERMKHAEVKELVPEHRGDPVKIVNDYEEGNLLAREIDAEVAEIKAKSSAGKYSEKDAEYANKFLKGITAQGPKGRGRLNPKTAGDLHSDGTVRLAGQLAETAGFKKKTVSVTESITEIFKRHWDSDTKQFEENYKLMFGPDIPREKMVAQMALVEKMGYDSSIAYTQGRILRSQLIRELGEATDTVIAKGTDASIDDIREFVSSLLEFDKIDSSLQGYISQAGRILNLQKVNPTDMRAKLLKMQGDIVQTKSERAKNIKNVNEIMQLIDGNTITPKDKKTILEKAVLIKSKDLNKESLQEAMKVKLLGEIYLSNMVGSVLSGAVTLVRSVLIGGLYNTVYKGLLEGSLRQLANKGSITRRVKSMSQVALAGAKLNRDAYSNISKLLLDKNTDYTSLLSAKGKKLANGDSIKAIDLIKAEIRQSVNHYADIADEYAKLAKESNNKFVPITKILEFSNRAKSKLLDNNIAPWLTLASGTFIRGMEELDNYVKTINLAGDIDTEAMIRYASDNVDKLFGGRDVSQEEFIKRFTAQAGELAEIKNTNDTKAYEEFTKGLHPEALNAMEESLERVNQRALETTLQESLDDAPALKIINDSINRAKSSDSFGMRTVTTAFFPFTKSALNGIRGALEMHPVTQLLSGRYQKLMLKAIKEGDRNAQVDIATKFAGATILTSGIAVLLNSTEIVGAHIPDHLKHHPDIKERTIRIGDKFYSYDGLGPISSRLSISADMHNIQIDSEMPLDSTSMGDQLMELSMLTLDNMGSDSGLGAIKDLGTLISSGTEEKTQFTRVLGNKLVMLSTPMSGAQRSIGKLIEASTGKKKRLVEAETDRVLGELYAKTLSSAGVYSPQWTALGSITDGLGLSNLEYANKVDTLGTTRDVSFLGALGDTFGLRSTNATSNRVLRAMGRYGELPDPYSVNRTGTIEGVDMTYDQESRFREAVWQGENGVLNQVDIMMDTQAWSKASPVKRKEILQGIKADAKSRATALMKLTGEFDEKIAEKKRNTLIESLKIGDPDFDENWLDKVRIDSQNKK